LHAQLCVPALLVFNTHTFLTLLKSGAFHSNKLSLSFAAVFLLF
jgi:hypothetical protein